MSRKFLIQKDFIDCLVHKWDNIDQAQSNPNEYSHVHYDWFIEDDQLKSKQWYHWNNEVYRERTNELSLDEDKIILSILETGIDVVFTQDSDGYIGRVLGKIYKGVKVESYITLNEHTYTSFDQGIDSNGKVIWGDIAGPFIFHHTSVH